MKNKGLYTVILLFLLFVGAIVMVNLCSCTSNAYLYSPDFYMGKVIEINRSYGTDCRKGQSTIVYCDNTIFVVCGHPDINIGNDVYLRNVLRRNFAEPRAYAIIDDNLYEVK